MLLKPMMTLFRKLLLQIYLIKERRIKHNSQEWLDGEISEAIKNRDKLLKNF